MPQRKRKWQGVPNWQLLKGNRVKRNSPNEQMLNPPPVLVGLNHRKNKKDESESKEPNRVKNQPIIITELKKGL